MLVPKKTKKSEENKIFDSVWIQIQ